MLAEPSCLTIALCLHAPSSHARKVVRERVHGWQNSANMWRSIDQATITPRADVLKALDVDGEGLFSERRKASSSLLGWLSDDEDLWLMEEAELECMVVCCWPKSVLAQP